MGLHKEGVRGLWTGTGPVAYAGEEEVDDDFAGGGNDGADTGAEVRQHVVLEDRGSPFDSDGRSAEDIALAKAEMERRIGEIDFSHTTPFDQWIQGQQYMQEILSDLEIFLV